MYTAHAGRSAHRHTRHGSFRTRAAAALCVQWLERQCPRRLRTPGLGARWLRAAATANATVNDVPFDYWDDALQHMVEQCDNPDEKNVSVSVAPVCTA